MSKGERIDHRRRSCTKACHWTSTAGAINYYGKTFEADLASTGIALLRPARQGEPARTGEQFFKPLRQVIEFVDDTLKGPLDLEAHGGRTIDRAVRRPAGSGSPARIDGAEGDDEDSSGHAVGWTSGQSGWQVIGSDAEEVKSLVTIVHGASG